MGQQAGLAIDATETAGKGNKKLEICAPAASFSAKTTSGEEIRIVLLRIMVWLAW